MLSKLPRSLTRCINLPQPSTETIKSFPPQLTHLSEVPYSPEIYANLPTSLRSLSGLENNRSNGAQEGDAKIGIPKLPDSLTVIMQFSPEYLYYHKLPPNIRDLRLRRFCELERAHMADFPKTLESLSLLDTQISARFAFDALPRYLTHLELGRVGFPQMSAADCSNLPRTLKSLWIHPVRFTDPNPFANFPTA